MMRAQWWVAAAVALLPACGDIPLPPVNPDAKVDQPVVADKDQDGYTALNDCDDDRPDIHPGAAEVPYDGIDQDCDGKDLTDVDKDGVDAVKAGGKDCDDMNPTVNPGGTEVCGDGIDQDCSGDDQPCIDADLDGDKYSPNQGDCNDTDPKINPGMTEVPYNAKDDDCNPVTPDDDLDGDGFAKNNPKLPDCDDTDKKIFPGAEEVPYDGIDQDCSGADLTDVDKDGFPSTKVTGGTDCDDNNSFVKPGGVEVCGDTIDQDCSGADLVCSNVDADGDSYSPATGDCDDTNKAINPKATEIPYTGKDEDCNPATPDDDLDGDGFAKQGGGDCNDSAKTVYPGAPEIPYDGIDQDCNGKDLTDADGDGYPSTKVAGGTDCDDLAPKVNPGAAEIPYDGIDQNCDGADTVTKGSVELAAGTTIGSDFGFAGTGTAYLLAYRETITGDPAPYRVMGQRVDASGAKQGAAFAIWKHAKASPSEIRVVSDGNGYLVFFRIYDGGAYSLQGQLVTGAGALSGNAFVIVQGSSAQSDLSGAFASLYGVAWRDNTFPYQLYLQVLTPAGGLQGKPFQLTSSSTYNYQPSVAPSGNNFLVTWYRTGASSTDIFGRLVSTAPAAVTQETIISDALSTQAYARAASSAAGSLVVFLDYRLGSNTDIYGQLVTAAGVPVGSTSTNIPIGTSAGRILSAPAAVTFCKGRYNVAFFDDRYKQKYTIFRQPVATDGTLKDALSAQNILLYASGLNLAWLNLGCAGGSALAVFYETAATSSRIVAVPFLP